MYCRGYCIYRPERSVTLWPFTAGATRPTAKFKRPQPGQKATQRGSRCLSMNIPSLMTDLCAPMQSLRLSCGETQIRNKHAVLALCLRRCVRVWVEEGLIQRWLNNVTPIRADLNVKGVGLCCGTSG